MPTGLSGTSPHPNSRKYADPAWENTSQASYLNCLDDEFEGDAHGIVASDDFS